MITTVSSDIIKCDVCSHQEKYYRNVFVPEKELHSPFPYYLVVGPYIEENIHICSDCYWKFKYSMRIVGYEIEREEILSKEGLFGKLSNKLYGLVGVLVFRRA
jgi:hypothetical protein